MGMRSIILTVIMLAGAGAAVYGVVPAAAGKARGTILVADNAAAEITFWESVKDTKNTEELELFLAAFPDGVFSALAKVRLNGLRREQPEQGTAQSEAVLSASPSPGSTPATAVGKNDPPRPTALKAAGHVGIEFDDIAASEKISGVRILKIHDFGTARQSALVDGDVVSTFNGKIVSTKLQFAKLMQNSRPGGTVKLTVIRGEIEKTIELSIGDWLEQTWNGAQNGDRDAMRHLAHAFRRGDVVKKDFGENRNWLKRAGELGSGTAYYTLGGQYYEGSGVEKNKDLAFSYMMKSAELNHSMGQFWTAYLYGLGAGVAKNDEQAVHWYRKAAAQGIAPAMTNLGIRYQVGRGVQKDMQRAADWYEKAADAGHMKALSGLGYMYKHGKGGRSKDIAKAVSLFRRAADKGNASGTYNLGLMYLDGVGVLEDRSEALRLFRLAAKSDKRAVKRLKKLGEPLYDLAEIQRLLSDRGFEPGPADGKIGRKTRDAISRYQRQAGLDPSGEPSMDLVKALRKSTFSSAPASGSGSAISTSRNNDASSSPGNDDLSDLATLD